LSLAVYNEIKKRNFYMKQYDVVVLGAGPGGYVSAIKASQAGLTVCIIEKGDFGGVCLNYGCIPTKTLEASAYLMEKIQKSAEFGIKVENAVFDFSKVMERKENTVKLLRSGVEALLKSNNIDMVKGQGFVLDDKTVEIKESKEIIEYKNLIIATGANFYLPKSLQGNDPDKAEEKTTMNCCSEGSCCGEATKQPENILTAKDMLSISEIPKNLLVIGGGAIGCEFSSIFSAFGTKITIVELENRLLPNMDEDISKEITRSFKKKNIKIYAGKKVLNLKNTEEGVLAEIEDLEQQVFDKVLISAGVKPAIDFFNKNKLNLEITDNNFIKIDNTCKTNIDNIYAVGDVTGVLMLAHTAYYQAEIAVSNIIGKNIKADYSSIPFVLYTNLEAGSVGLKESDIQDKDQVNIAKFPFLASARARTLGETAGFVKIISDKQTDVVLGVHIVGAGASELIAEAVVYVDKKLKIKDICEIIHAHPSMSEGLMEAALLSHGKAIHLPKR
jgi:dihydrolipoamide dehydrogenase